MDLIKSGRYIDIFYAKTCATTTVAGYHVVSTLLLSCVLRCVQFADNTCVLIKSLSSLKTLSIQIDTELQTFLS